MRSPITKKILLFLLAPTVSLYISSAERPIVDTSFETVSKRIAEGNMSYDALLEILKKRGEQLKEKVAEIKDRYNKEVQQIQQQYMSNSQVYQHVIEKKGVLFNAEGRNALMQRDIDTHSSKEKIVAATQRATDLIEIETEKQGEEERRLIALWINQGR